MGQMNGTSYIAYLRWPTLRTQPAKPGVEKENTVKYVVRIGLAISLLLTLANIVFKLKAWPGGALYMLMGLLVLPLAALGLIVYQTIWPSEPETPKPSDAGPEPCDDGKTKVFLREGEDFQA